MKRRTLWSGDLLHLRGILYLCEYSQNLPSCPSKPSLTKRHLLDEKSATELEGVFETLASATRLRILHALGKGRGSFTKWPC